ncbi:glutathione-regulated potassium-efflux system ancillary protein KefG [Providencia alcalifaciens]|uniref:glutathione-regulated potassium-efflux system ancillary protein KefG n=1 Tax=Providencia alcalifaciens TaxID=126385 RepID=UPI001CE10F42|nr:glutathione-regulated potassium-efflux system ancillary protein KefG [Providencia alcalifaciens]UBX50687.1 glutathione-regulated potassium-efflux system ancillary protein KefG [Providencia alcalifaciens]
MSNTPKVLVVYAHPDPDESVANRLLLNAVRDFDHVTIHDLYATYPDYFIDVTAEQKLLCQYDVIVFQHPLYTYSCPALLKEWFDRVLTRRFATDQGYQKLKGKYWRSIITTGEPEEAYQYGGYNRYPLSEILRPFELTSLMCDMHWIEPNIIYSARRKSPQQLQQMVEEYKQWMRHPLNTGDISNG